MDLVPTNVDIIPLPVWQDVIYTDLMSRLAEARPYYIMSSSFSETVVVFIVIITILSSLMSSIFSSKLLIVVSRIFDSR
jgi:hypothetical protein